MSAYEILDIRDTALSTGKQHTEDDTLSSGASEGRRLPTPPASSTENTMDAFGGDDLADSIIDSLNKPEGQKTIPTFVLYDKKGLQLFDAITYLDEYYLTGAEIDILKRKADEVVSRLKDGSVIIELGAG